MSSPREFRSGWVSFIVWVFGFFVGTSAGYILGFVAVSALASSGAFDEAGEETINGIAALLGLLFAFFFAFYFVALSKRRNRTASIVIGLSGFFIFAGIINLVFDPMIEAMELTEANVQLADGIAWLLAAIIGIFAAWRLIRSGRKPTKRQSQKSDPIIEPTADLEEPESQKPKPLTQPTKTPQKKVEMQLIPYRVPTDLWLGMQLELIYSPGASLDDILRIKFKALEKHRFTNTAGVGYSQRYESRELIDSGVEWLSENLMPGDWKSVSISDQFRLGEYSDSRGKLRILGDEFELTEVLDTVNHTRRLGQKIKIEQTEEPVYLITYDKPIYSRLVFLPGPLYGEN